MVNKSTKRRIRKNRRKVKRGIRHRIINQSINPNLSVRSNVISTNIPQNSNTSVRSKIMQNLQNPLLPIALSQTPPNVNLDAINNMRNQNDARQQQINDYKRAKDDELARKKELDKDEDKLKKDVKEAEKKYEEEKEQRIFMEKQNEEKEKLLKKAEKEREEANTLSEKLLKMNMELTKRENTYDLDNLRNQRDTLKVAIAEMEHNIQQQQYDFDKKQFTEEIKDLESKNKELDDKKKELQEMSSKYKREDGLKKLAEIQHKNNLKKYQTEIAEKRFKILQDNFNLKIQLQSELSKEDMDKINAEEKAKLEAAIQENIRLQQAIKDTELSRKIYNEQHDLLETEKLKNVHLQNDLYKSKQLNDITDSTNINEELQKTMTDNVNNSKKLEQLNMLEKSRNDNMQSTIKAKSAETAANYYLTQESLTVQQQLIESEKQTLNNLKKTEALNDLEKAQHELWKSNIAQSKAQYLVNNNDANVVTQVAYLENELSNTQNIASEKMAEKQIVINSINERYNVTPDEVIQKFYVENPKYQPVNAGSPENYPLEYLQELDRDLAAYIDKNGTSN